MLPKLLRCRVSSYLHGPRSRSLLFSIFHIQETVSEWVPGLQIIAARVAKPDIPKQLRGDFVRVEEEVSKLKVRVDAVDMVCLGVLWPFS